MKRIRITQWETSDGRHFPFQADAIAHEKRLAIGKALAAPKLSLPPGAITALTDALLASDRLLIALRPTSKGDRS